MIDPAHVMRDAVLRLLSRNEVAHVVTAAHPRCLLAGAEYLDLDHVELGVRQASGFARPRGNVLARTAVSELTWRRIVSMLVRRPS